MRLHSSITVTNVKQNNGIGVTNVVTFHVRFTIYFYELTTHSFIRFTFVLINRVHFMKSGTICQILLEKPPISKNGR